MPHREQLATEQDQHRLAFEQYYALGAPRTYLQVAPKLGVSATTVKRWARTFGWRQRLRERDADAARQLADRALQAGGEERARNRKIVQMALVKLAKAIAEGKVRMQLADLDRLLRLDAFLAGQTDPHAAPTLAELDRLIQQAYDALPEEEKERWRRRAANPDAWSQATG